MSIVIDFISRYFLEGAIVFVIAAVSKVLSKFLSNDRIDKLKDAVLVAMLFAEEKFGIGHGDEKWTLAWQKIIEILQKQGIKLSNKEITLATTLMKATVPEVNQIAYSCQPETAKKEKFLSSPPKDLPNLVETLRKKYPKEVKPK